MYSRCSFHCVHILMPSSANVEIRQTRAKIGSTCFPFRATWNGRKRMHSEVDTNLLNKTIFHCSWAFQNVKWRWQCVMQASKNQTRKWFGFGKVNRWEKAWPRRGFRKVRNVSASPWPSITRGIEKVLFTHSAVSSALEIHSFCVAILDVIEYFGRVAKVLSGRQRSLRHSSLGDRPLLDRSPKREENHGNFWQSKIEENWEFLQYFRFCCLLQEPTDRSVFVLVLCFTCQNVSPSPRNSSLFCFQIHKIHGFSVLTL